jgi:hypothetical protein
MSFKSASTLSGLLGEPAPPSRRTTITACRRRERENPREVGNLAGEEGFRTFGLLIQRTPDVFVSGRCGLSVARTRIRSLRRAIRLNWPDGVR